jgi:hypothetical protein
MAENKKIENAKKIEDESLDKVTGGGLFSTYSEAEFNRAGVEVIGWGYLWNDGYRLMTSGEELGMNDAEEAVIYHKYKGIWAPNKDAIKYFMKNEWRNLAGVDDQVDTPMQG